MEVHRFDRERREKRTRASKKNPKYFAGQASQTAKSAKNKGKMRFCASIFSWILGLREPWRARSISFEAGVLAEGRRRIIGYLQRKVDYAHNID